VCILYYLYVFQITFYFPTLRYRQLRGDIIQLHKYVTNKDYVNFKLKLDHQSMLEVSYDTRGNRYKLVPKLCKYELRK